MSTTFTVTSYGARHDGVTNDAPAIQRALNLAAAANGSLYFPAGVYRINTPIKLPPAACRLAIRGDGANVSVLFAHACGGFELAFQQDGAQQPYGVTIRDLGLRAYGSCGTALGLSYGDPTVSNDHNRPSVSIANVVIESGPLGDWSNGIVIEAAWNVTLDNVYASGSSAAGNWNAMTGHGLRLRRLCANFHATNCRFNFWAVGVHVHSENQSTEGLFFSNCSMVAVKRGVWVCGNPALTWAPRISTFVWNGGMIECRVGKVTGGSAAFHLQRVWTGLISGCQMLTETITDNVETTYGVCIQDCHGIVVSGCDINAFIKGVFSSGECQAINANGLTFTNTPTQIEFNPGTTNSRSYGHVLVDLPRVEVDRGNGNEIW